MIATISNDNQKLRFHFPVDKRKGELIKELFDQGKYEIGMWFNGEWLNLYDFDEANKIAEFLIKHGSYGDVSTGLEEMIERYAYDEDILLSKAIEAYENNEMLNKYFKDCNCECEK